MIVAGDAIPLPIERLWRLESGDSIALPLGEALSARASIIAPQAYLTGSARVPIGAFGTLCPTARPIVVGAAIIINEARAALRTVSRPQLRLHAGAMYVQVVNTAPRQSWQYGTILTSSLSGRWDHGVATVARHTDMIRPAPAVRSTNDLGWQHGRPAIMGQHETPWDRAVPRSSRFGESWDHGPTLSTASLQPWRQASSRHTRFDGNFQHGCSITLPLLSAWQHGVVRCHILVDTWQHGRLTARRFPQTYQHGWLRVLWPRPVILPPVLPIGPDIAPGDAIALPLRGAWLLLGDNIPLPIGVITIGRWRPFVMPIFSLVRLPDRASIHVVSLSYDMDIQSWSDEAVLTLRHATDFDIAKEAAEVEVNVQGYTRRLVVTGYAINRRYGETTYTITARSPTVYLGEGYAPLQSYTVEQARTARQIAAANLPDGWSLDWNTVDWTIPGGIYTASRETVIDTIKRLAGSVQSVVLPHAADDAVIVAPFHAYSSWEWVNKTPYAISTSAVLYSQYSANRSNFYNAVYLSGTQNGGIERRVLRQGSAGDLTAPDQTNDLFVHDDPVREAGRILLSQSGRLGYQTVELPLADAPNHPRLLAIGELVEVNDGHEIFRGMVTQVKIDLSFGGIPKQTATIERHL